MGNVFRSVVRTPMLRQIMADSEAHHAHTAQGGDTRARKRAVDLVRAA